MTVASTVEGIEIGEHVVQFYEGEPDLAEAVGAYLSAGARAGDVEIVIATPAHRAAFEAGLTARGVDVACARDAGRYLEFDAAETLALFSGEDGVDREAYFATVGEIVRRAAATGQRVKAYGEMVALLWETGRVLDAIKLEALWNELGEQVPLSLYCAYPRASVSSAEQAEALGNVCHLHSSVIGATDPRTPRQQSLPLTTPVPTVPPQPQPQPSSETMRAALNLPAELAAPGTARRFVTATLSAWGYGKPLIRDAASVVTELATNAVLHVGGPFDVSLSSDDGAMVRICVQDGGPGASTVVAELRQARRGHGLGLVAAIASRWGVEPETDGKVVWADLLSR
jgi:anti-sigma regulatory factor (Ser/Thr protein kinase)